MFNGTRGGSSGGGFKGTREGVPESPRVVSRRADRGVAVDPYVEFVVRGVVGAIVRWVDGEWVRERARNGMLSDSSTRSRASGFRFVSRLHLTPDPPLLLIAHLFLLSTLYALHSFPQRRHSSEAILMTPSSPFSLSSTPHPTVPLPTYSNKENKSTHPPQYTGGKMSTTPFSAHTQVPPPSSFPLPPSPVKQQHGGYVSHYTRPMPASTSTSSSAEPTMTQLLASQPTSLAHYSRRNAGDGDSTMSNATGLLSWRKGQGFKEWEKVKLNSMEVKRKADVAQLCEPSTILLSFLRLPVSTDDESVMACSLLRSLFRQIDLHPPTQTTTRILPRIPPNSFRISFSLAHSRTSPLGMERSLEH